MRTLAKCGPGFAILLIALVLAGCATPSQTGAAMGATTGAAAGAIIGRNVGGAAIGAILGGMAGAIIGETAAQSPYRSPQAAPPPPPPYPPSYPPVAAAPPPPPPGVTVTAPQPGDPTKGIIVNGTRWEVHVFIDAAPGPNPTLVLRPSESLPVNLDVGPHHVVARAYVDTQFGKRPVGTSDQALRVDARSSGWSIRFVEQSF